MKSNNYLLGLLGTLGIWLTAGISMPLVNVLSMFSPEQLMIFRGFITALMVLIVLRGAIGKVDKYAWFIAFNVPFTSLCLFEGIRHWGVGPTIIIFAATPVVNFVISLFTGRKIALASVTGFLLILGGIVLARHGGHFEWAGFAWSVFGTISNGVMYEWFSRSKAQPLQKAFFGGLGVGTLGLILGVSDMPWSILLDPKIALLLLGFDLIGGFLFWVAHMVAFDNLPKDEASVLIQGKTPASIIGAYFLLGERMTPVQSVGVFISLFGAWYLTRWLAQKPEQKTELVTAELGIPS